MIRDLLLLAALAASPPAGDGTVTVQSGETLEAVARRALGDADAAAELKALNRLSNGHVRGGEKLRIPGPERELAKAAIAEAEVALAKPEVEAKAKQKGLDTLARARVALRGARYGEAIEAARDALRAGGLDASKSRFSVTVADDGTTRVSVDKGPPVVVEANGKALAVAEGKSSHVAPGLAPDPPQTLLSAPAPREPLDGAVLHTGFTEGLIGPLAFTWGEVAGAEMYVVQVTRDVEGKDLVARHEIARPPLVTALAPGRYFWRSAARGANGLPGHWSPAIGFTVEPPPPKLEVGSPTWR